MMVGSVALVGCGGDEPVVPAPALPSGTTHWVRRFTQAGMSQPGGLAVDAAGNVVVAGRYHGTPDFGGGVMSSPGNNYQAFVARYDANGEHVYSRAFGDVFAEGARDVALLPDGSAIVVGSFGGTIDFGTGPFTSVGLDDMFVVKLGPDGETQWAKQFGDVGYETAVSVAVAPDGGVAITGRVRGQFDLAGTKPVEAPQNYNAFVMRLGPGGEPLWTRIFPGPVALGWGVAARANGGVVVVGSYSERLAVGAPAELVPVMGGYRDGYVVALDGEGKHEWSHSLGGSSESDARGVTIDAGGRVLVAGRAHVPALLAGVQYTSDVSAGLGPSTYVLELEDDGSHVRAHLFPGHYSNSGNAVAVDRAGDLIFAGTVFDNLTISGTIFPSSGADDAFVAKLQRAGEPVFVKVWGSPSNEEEPWKTTDESASRVATDGAGNVYVLGAGLGAIDFGLGLTPGSGYEDLFLVKLAP
jgi:hypothetical protein